MYQMSQSQGTYFSSRSSHSFERFSSDGNASFLESKLEYIARPFQIYMSITGDTAAPDYIGPIQNHQKNVFIESFISHYRLSLSYQLSQRENNYTIKKQTEDLTFQPDNFLKVGAQGKFVGKAEDIKEYIEEAYNLLFGQNFPDDIKISLLDEKEFRKIAPAQGVVGLSINRRKQGLLSEIFILQGSIGKVLLTVGHELGHVLTSTLDHSLDEEAKAYAFSLQWIDLIKEWNIAGLKEAIITETPAENGLHNRAYYFIRELMQQGKLAWEIYLNLTKKEISLATGNYCLISSKILN